MTTRLRRALLAALAAALAVLVGSTGAQALSPVSGSGSTYVGVAMRKWVADGQTLGMSVNYTPSGSPTGLSLFNQSSVDFAGTEAEFASIGMAAPTRGYQYVPDVAGAVAIMYNINESSGRKVDYLHLDRRTVARIFIGEITKWDDPAIVATNRNIHFPSQPIRVVLRGNPSGTTALFYDFISTTLGAEYAARWAQYGCQGVQGRPVLIQCNTGFISNVVQFNDSDQIANYLATDSGKWSIGFDEFGYAKVYGTSTAWVQNAGGTYVLPYAQNISAALESARLRPDLSQDLSGVYGSTNPQAYPISAYSYIVTQCAPASSRPTCKGAYSDAGKSQTLAKWMSYIACDGQVSMAQLGYSPLPPNLSQEMANSVARLTGTAPTTLSAANCTNPRFRGSLGAGSTSPCDPFVCGAGAGSSTGGGGGTRGTGTSGAGSTTQGGTTGGTSGGRTAGGTTAGGNTTGGAASAAKGATGAPGATSAGGAAATSGGKVAAVAGQGGGAPVVALGGSDASTWQNPAPVKFDAAVPEDPFGWLPAVIVLVALLAPAFVVNRRRAKSGADLSPDPAPRP